MAGSNAGHGDGVVATFDGAGDDGSASLGTQPAEVSGFGPIEDEERGDVVEIPVRGVAPDGYVTITLGSEDEGYVSNVTVHDEDGDGGVTVRWNSYLADGNQELGVDSPWSGTDGDTVVNQDSRSSIADGPSHIISAGTYTLAAREGRMSDGAAGDPAEALDTLSLSTRSTNSVGTWTAPRTIEDELTTVNDIESRLGNDVTRTNEIAEDDVLITAIDAEGLEGVLKAQDGASPTARFYSAADAGVLQLNHTELIQGATNENSDTISIDRTDARQRATFLPNYDEGIYYVVYDTSDDERLTASTTFRTQFTVESLHENNVNFGLVPPDSNGEFSDQVVSSDFDVVRKSLEISTNPSDVVGVRAQSGQTISGTATYAPGTELSLRVEAKSDSSSQFLLGPRELTVGNDGTWSTTFDFSQYNVGSTFTVRVQKGDETTVTADGEIQGAPEVLTLAFDDQQTRGQVVRVTEAEFNTGGFVVIRDGSSSGQILGVSNYVEENSLAQNLQVILDQPLSSSKTLTAVPYVDSNNDGEFDPSTDNPFTTNGRPVSESARVTLEGAQPDFQVSNLDPAQVTAAQGEFIDVTATITNEGSADGTQSVELRLDGTARSTQEVTLGTGESRTVQFALPAEESPGGYEFGVYTDNDGQSGTLTIETQPSTRFDVGSVGNETVTAGTSTALSGTVTNTGGDSGTQTVELRIDGQAIDSQTVTLNGGEATTVRFADATAGLSAGTYTYTIASEDTSREAPLVVEAADSGSASLSVDEDGASTDSLTVSSVELSSGGFVAVHEGSPTGPVVGVSEYLEADREYQGVSVSYDESVDSGTETVAVAHYDTNGNEAFDYSSSGGQEDGAYALSGSAVSSQPATDSSNGGSSNTTTTTTESGGDSDGGGSDDGIIAGLGMVPLAAAAGAVILAGLGGVAYVSRRGDDDTPSDGPAVADDGPGAAPAGGPESEGPAPEPERESTTDRTAGGAAGGAAAGAGSADGYQPGVDATGPPGEPPAADEPAPDPSDESAASAPVDDHSSEWDPAAESADQPADGPAEEAADPPGADPAGDAAEPPESTEPPEEPAEAADQHDDAATEPAEADEAQAPEDADDTQPRDESGADAESDESGETAAEDGPSEEVAEPPAEADRSDEAAEGGAATGDEAAEGGAATGDEGPAGDSGAVDDGAAAGDDPTGGDGTAAGGAAAGAGAAGAAGGDESSATGAADAAGTAGAAGAAGAAAGAAGGGQGGGPADGAPSDDPVDIGETLEWNVPSLGDVQLQDAGPAVATYGATMAAQNGTFPVEVLTVAPGIAIDPGLVEQFEAIASRWFNASTHPNVRTLHDWGTEPRPYLTVDGLPAAQTFENARGAMRIDQTVNVVGATADALDAVAQQGGHHLNLSLEAIKVIPGQDGYAVAVDDWGLERAITQHTDGQHLTPYTAPEQLDREGDARTDVYGLGAVTYEAMTGRLPSRAEPASIRDANITHANEFVQISPQMDIAIMSALAHDPADRQQSPQAYARALADSLR